MEAVVVMTRIFTGRAGMRQVACQEVDEEQQVHLEASQIRGR